MNNFSHSLHKNKSWLYHTFVNEVMLHMINLVGNKLLCVKNNIINIPGGLCKT